MSFPPLMGECPSRWWGSLSRMEARSQGDECVCVCKTGAWAPTVLTPRRKSLCLKTCGSPHSQEGCWVKVLF